MNTLASGIQYKIIKQGSGKYPNYGDTVDIVSQLRVLDASGQERDRLNSISLSINLRMLPDSFIEAISHVGEGGVTEFFAPPVMATYVPRALLGGVDLEPEDTLVVEITLTEIESEK